MMMDDALRKKLKRLEMQKESHLDRYIQVWNSVDPIISQWTPGHATENLEVLLSNQNLFF